MNRFSRRRLFGALSAFSLLALARCATPGAMTPAQVVADAAGVLAGLMNANTIVASVPGQTIDPPATADKITSDLTLGQTITSTLAANLPPVATGQTQMQTVDGYINGALNVLAAVTPAAAMLFPPLSAAVPFVEAAIVLAPVIEAFVTPAGGVAALRAKAIAPAMTVQQARAVLGIKVAS